MEKPSCKTYFAVSCPPHAERDVERYLRETLGASFQREGRLFVIGYNEAFDINVNEMIRFTLRDLFGKEEKIREMQKTFSARCVLEIVPWLISRSEEPSQILSLEKDIVEFLYRSDTSVDLDYYID